MLLYFIPIVNFIVALIVTHKLAIAFGKGIGWTLLLFFLPFIGYPMLGFGNAKFTPLHEVNPANTPDTEDDIKA